MYLLLNLCSYLSVHAYSLVAVTIISHNQIGLKFITPIIFLGFYGLPFMPFLSIYYDLSPTGWLLSVVIEQQIPYRYYSILLYQFIIALSASMIISYIKINFSSIIKIVRKAYNKKNIK